MQQFSLGAFGPGLRSPLQLKAQAALSEPPLNAALELEAGLSLLPAARPGAPPLLHLDKTSLRLRGQGFELEGLDARLQADTVRLEYGAEQGLGDSRIELQDAQLQFGGRRPGWHVDTGQLALARLRLDILERRLELDKLALQLKGRREAHHAGRAAALAAAGRAGRPAAGQCGRRQPGARRRPAAADCN